jgi:lysozyme family protein
MASFDIFLPMLLAFEGGYVDDPTDPGGETNKGITMSTFQHCSHELLGIDPTSDNLKALTDSQAGIIYKNKYWDKVQGDQITAQDLADNLCDFYVNAGTHATTLFQQAMKGLGANIVVDGILGAATIQALASLDQNKLYQAYRQGRIDYYQQLGLRFPQFLKGWLRRANAFPESLPS